MVTAITETIAARGYPDMTIVEVAARASASLSTFYANFENKEEALLAALERERDQSLTAFRAAYDAAPDWPLAMRAGLDALFGFLAAEPAAARVAVVGALTAGPDVLEAADRSAQALRQFMEPGREVASGQPELVLEALCNAVYALADGQIRADRTERLRELAPAAAFVQLAPFLGAEAACAAANS